MRVPINHISLAQTDRVVVFSGAVDLVNWAPDAERWHN